MIKKLEKEDLDFVLEILEKDELRFCDGNYPERNWVEHFFEEDRCFAFGLFEQDILVSVILAERLTFGGCMLWYIATKSGFEGNGCGTRLLNYFEVFVKENNINWIFLNATDNSFEFYKRNGYYTSDYSIVKEHVKDL